MASFKTSTGDVSFQLQNTESNPNINADGQNSGNKREDSVYEESANIEQDEQISGSKYVYEEPAITQRSGGQKEDKEPQANNWPVKCFMAMMIALVIAVVVLATLVVVLLFLTVFLSNETKKINAQHTDANRRNDVNSNRITENLARLADGLTNISIKIDSVAGELANVSSRIERVEVNLKEITWGQEIVLQRRKQFDILFNRTFGEYEAGFGDFSGAGDVWLGLNRMHRLTQKGRWNLRVSMRSFSNNTLFWGEWSDFTIQPAPFYNISFGTMVAKSENMYNTSGTGSGLDWHNGMAFTTTDRDQDEHIGNCAARFGEGGGWWYRSCSNVYLNGKLVTSEAPLNQHMRYIDGGSSEWILLSSSEMRMIRVG
ncbi:angiopoietin-related protein 7-like [Symsagittifera roscoffensis]|uniref:angiopoietin-related protein 7-like n=1 Tax=Symsagittifera roscoffensis TaxID=84072 RepID=UPI00307BA1CC